MGEVGVQPTDVVSAMEAKSGRRAEAEVECLPPGDPVVTPRGIAIEGEACGSP